MNVLIVEDETTAYENMVDLLAQVDPNIHVVGNTESIRQTIKWLGEHEAPDLIFMDIKMEKMSGLKTAEEIRKTDSTVGLFFLTSLSQYVWKGYEYGAINYLLKPMKYGRLKMELDRFFSRYQGREEPYISFSNDNGKYKVLYKNLRYAETSRRNVLLHFDDQEQVIYKSMKEVASLLETQPQFARCHASYVVNLSFVKSVQNLEAVLTTGERVPISQPKRKEFMAKLADFWGDML